mmetsp:Transcript_21598/g.50406  ORF Transcript_21598/g.50406 Transcript_21598/m.50406 type:complete len:379 (+) Transcript_21598:19-1155(+)
MLLYNYKLPCVAFFYIHYILQDRRIWMSILMTLPTMIATAFLKGYEVSEGRQWFRKQVADEDGVLYSSLSFFVSFVVLFRIDLSYLRFKDGCKNAFIMTGDFFDSASLLISFCRASSVDQSLIDNFQHQVIRLFSLLNALIFADLEDKMDDMEEAFNYEVIDIEGFDQEAIDHLRKSKNRVPIVFQWLQDVMVDNVHNGVLKVPPPIITRAFQELGRGMVKYHEATDVARVPFPFPLASTTELLLVAQCCITPVVIVQWTDYVSLAIIFSFLLVFILWFFVGVSTHLENPFDGGRHSLNTRQLQHEFNSRLLTLLLPETQRMPQLSSRALVDFKELNNNTSGVTLRKSMRNVGIASAGLSNGTSSSRTSQMRGSRVST